MTRAWHADHGRGHGPGRHDAIPGLSFDRVLLVVIDGFGSVLTTGIKGDATINFNCFIRGWSLLADQSGSIQIDVWKDVYANFPPTVADSITASAPPTLSSAASATDTTLTGWTTTVTAGDVLRFNVDSVSTVTRVTLALTLSTDPVYTP